MSRFNKSNVRQPGNPWNTQRGNKPPKNAINSENMQSLTEIKFKDAQKKFQEAAQKYANDYESSSEEEEVQSDTIISK